MFTLKLLFVHLFAFIHIQGHDQGYLEFDSFQYPSIYPMGINYLANSRSGIIYFRKYNGPVQSYLQDIIYDQFAIPNFVPTEGAVITYFEIAQHLRFNFSIVSD